MRHRLASLLVATSLLLSLLHDWRLWIQWKTLDLDAPDTSDLATTTCRIAVQNKADYHYEILESLAVRYPLPPCGDQVIVDFALTQQHTFPQAAGEREGWERYFETHLRGTQRVRDDGTPLIFGDLVDYTNYRHEYDAVIEATCDDFAFRPWLRSNDKAYCVLHTSCAKCGNKARNRTLWLNPMHESYILPSVVPDVRRRPHDGIRVCTSGTGRHHGWLARAAAAKGSFEVWIHGRSDRVPRAYLQHNVSSVHMVHEPDYYKFHESIAQCDILLPLLEPDTHPDYFKGGRQKLSGSIALIVGHAIPTVVPTALEQIYRDEWTGLVSTYTDEASFYQALLEVVHSLQE